MICILGARDRVDDSDMGTKKINLFASDQQRKKEKKEEKKEAFRVFGTIDC